MLRVDEVLAEIQQNVAPLPVEHVSLPDAAGRILAGPIAMTDDSPPFDRAQLDGYAVCAAEVLEGGILQVTGQVDAGGGLSRLAGPGRCMAINTGAPVPTGADAVLMVEQSEREERDGKLFVRAKKAVPAGYGIQKRGSDARAGESVLQPGCRLMPQHLAICAAAGGANGVPIRRLRAAVLTTGDELVDPTVTPVGGQIRNSNHVMLMALLQHAGAVPSGGGLADLGSCGDDADRLRALLASGLERCDLLVVSGGMSMGTKDLVPPLLKELGVRFFVEKVRMKPGKPFIFGSRSRAAGGVAYVVGLPGNPVSAFVTFHRFGCEIIRRLLGETAGDRMIEAEAGAGLEANGDREFYQPCTLVRRGAVLLAEPLRWKGSADLFTLAKAQGLIVRPAAAGPVSAGTRVPVLLLGGLQ